MNDILKRLREEPALGYGLVGSLIALGVAFGLHVTPEQTGAILAVVNIVIALLTRQQVVPLAKLTPTERVDPDAEASP